MNIKYSDKQFKHHFGCQDRSLLDLLFNPNVSFTEAAIWILRRLWKSRNNISAKTDALENITTIGMM